MAASVSGNISIGRYVNINSGIGAGPVVNTRNLGACIITGNPLVPTNTFLSFNDAADVGTYFGFASEEYARAQFYSGWISKNITTPQQLSFWNWNNDAATGSLIYGVKNPSVALANFTGITTGDFTLTLGGFTHHLTGISLSGAGSLAAVAADIQTAIQAFSGGGTAWTGATVSYDATNSRFNLVSGLTGVDTVSVTAGVTTDVASLLGWIPTANGTPILSNGTAAQLVTAMLTALQQTDNNFGSFCFTTALAVTEANIIAAATWNNSTSPNIMFMFSVNVTPANASTWSAALIGIGGVTLTLASPVTGEYPEMAPMMILAATDYTKKNAVQNYMYQIFNLTPSVTTDANANIYDALRINYYGQTQTAGQILQFYQRGLMMGLPVNPADQNIYGNEIWFKDALSAQLMTLLLALAFIGANTQGRAQIIVTLQGVISLALSNGTISVGKTLTNAQQLYIGQITGDPNAWQQVQNVGWWLSVVIQSYVNQQTQATEYKAVYTLVYSKGDAIRLIQGSDILI